MKVRIFSDKRKSAGCCIYCDSCDDLTIEHIIPFGLWGRIEFADASCKCCAKKVNEGFEALVQQKHMGAFRARAKLPLRKKRKRNYKFKLSFGTRQGDPPAPLPIEIGGDEVPRDLLLLRFLPPQIFIGPWPRSPEIWMHRDEGDWSELLERHGNAAIFMGEYHNDKFCRLIAKIGHGLVHAYMPPMLLRSFEFLLPDLILNGSDNYHHLIGGDFTVPPANDLMHEWDISNAIRADTEYLFARIRLFACLGTPRYHAVVAKRPLGETTATKDPVRFPAP